MVLTEIPTHLVLGGSHGIGYAYAEHWARYGHRLILVARAAHDLHAAATKLLSAGASNVQCMPGDVLDGEFRRQLFVRLANEMLTSVLIGGPSPPAGPLPTLSAEQFRTANEICVAYPVETLFWLSSRPGPRVDYVVVLSSSAIRDETCHPHFFLSGVYRRTLEDVIACFRRTHGLDIKTWYPVVVLTRLSEQFAERLGQTYPGVAPESILRMHLSADSVVTATAFVESQLHSLPHDRDTSATP